MIFFWWLIIPEVPAMSHWVTMVSRILIFIYTKKIHFIFQNYFYKKSKKMVTQWLMVCILAGTSGKPMSHRWKFESMDWRLMHKTIKYIIVFIILSFYWYAQVSYFEWWFFYTASYYHNALHSLADYMVCDTVYRDSLVELYTQRPLSDNGQNRWSLYRFYARISYGY